MLKLSLSRIAISTVALSLLVLVPVAGQGGATIRLDPPSVSLAPGESVTVAVFVEGVTDLAGAEVHLVYDPAQVEVVDADPEAEGIQVEDGGFVPPDFVAQSRADPQSGTVDYAVALMPPHEPVGGSGPLLVLTLRSVAAGETTIAVREVLLATPDGYPIAIAAMPDPATVTVTASRSPTTCWPLGAVTLGSSGYVLIRRSGTPGRRQKRRQTNPNRGDER